MPNVPTSAVLPPTMLVVSAFGMLMPSFQEVIKATPQDDIGQSTRLAEKIATGVVVAIIILPAIAEQQWRDLWLALFAVAVLIAAFEIALGKV